MDKTAVGADDFEFDPEEFARVIREVGIEVAKFQEQIMKHYMEFGNAWNRILTPQFREMVENAVEHKEKIQGVRPQFSIIDEAIEFPEPDGFNAGEEPLSEYKEVNRT